MDGSGLGCLFTLTHSGETSAGGAFAGQPIPVTGLSDPLFRRAVRSSFALENRMRLQQFPAFLILLSCILLASVRSSAQSVHYSSFLTADQFAVNGNASVRNGVSTLR